VPWVTFEAVEVALQSIRAGKLRAALTMLGIIIGVAAVITMVAVGTGAQRAIDERIAALGSDLLSIYPGQHHVRGVASDLHAALTTDDAQALSRDAPLIAEVVPELQQLVQLEYGNQNLNVSVLGTTPNYDEVHNYHLDFGRMFTTGDDEARRRTAVLGSAIPEMLGTAGASMMGRTVLIGGIPFEIIGVFGEKGSEGSWWDPDEMVLIPLLTARYRVFGTDRLRSVSIQVAEGVPLEQGMVDAERVLRREHGISPGAENDFRIRNRQQLLTTQQEASQIFTTLLASIAGVSLLVGGIGIMNIMLVSVAERTREIGIRKALGATRINILMQFLVEALVLCLVGGMLGIVLGGAGSLVLARFAGWNTFISPGAVALAFAFSAAVGIFFGLWPARRAASLHPIEALRYE
jgi:putative ABC transport system permease protein